MKKVLERLFNHEELSREEANVLMREIADEKYNEMQLASLLTIYRMRPISIAEFAGFREALLDLMIKVDYDRSLLIDMCGTGGDGKNTFNISTLASVVVAGAGYKVAKHGNAAVSSVCGSSNVIQGLGYKFTDELGIIAEQLDQFNLSFMHAPLFHSALKPLGPVRKGMAVKTFFNMMGPLVNPAQPGQQVAGVYSLELIPFYSHIMNEGQINYSIVHALDGYDEISLTGTTKVVTEQGEELLEPADFNQNRIEAEQIFGADTIADAIKTFGLILKGQGTDAQNAVVLTNAALGIQTFDRQKSFDDCLLEAEDSLKNGKAFDNLEALIKSIQY
ncbi:anthranilate phosphoribosyltransferase [Portibacter marinus]|uniref:anthranilate phosphoribosyltransferase n=1 Tax=Portibacter marinus TaxID=2898660 RepID=UPI001F2ACC59|nr:anthranilate phosphoribosyltransferase [Portibacter marinus]